MQRTAQQLWQRFQKYYTEFPSLGLAIDLSRMDFPDGYFQEKKSAIQKAFTFMDALELGAIANPDEERRVGHYWLRNAALGQKAVAHQRSLPNAKDVEKFAAEVQSIEPTIQDIKKFAADVHVGRKKGQKGKFRNLLVIGIGGSALGPQFVSHALGNPNKDKMKPCFFDNTDPDGMDKVLASIGDQLGQTLCIVISKSGTTPETHNGMVEAKAAYQRAKLQFSKHTVAITMEEDSKLNDEAKKDNWLARFPIWDWVGGRTSETSAVGLLPAALQGLDIDEILRGARECDEITRKHDLNRNPAARLALMWHYIGNGKGEKDMVILPYKDRLELFSRYLQQLVMESLGKGKDLDDKKVCQGLTVFGNKGSTDQHAYIQQLREGLNNFFVIFIEVLKDRPNQSQPVMIEPDVTSGDFLQGLLLGTRTALYENGRQSVTLTIKDVSPFSVGVLIALFERTVGLYAQLININAYHQPGVQAGKKAAAKILELQKQILQVLKLKKGQALTPAQIAKEIMDVETVFKICEHLAANDRGIAKQTAKNPIDATYKML